MNAVGVPPEADLSDVAHGVFTGLAMPLLVAARDSKQFEEFVFRSGLICSNVRRLRAGMVLASFPENKVLLLLPGYWEDSITEHLVEHWADHLDRYTCEVENLPWWDSTLAGIMAVIALITFGGLVFKFL